MLKNATIWYIVGMRCHLVQVLNPNKLEKGERYFLKALLDARNFQSKRNVFNIYLFIRTVYT